MHVYFLNLHKENFQFAKCAKNLFVSVSAEVNKNIAKKIFFTYLYLHTVNTKNNHVVLFIETVFNAIVRQRVPQNKV